MQRLEGVIDTEVGYDSGTLKYPCYKLICTGMTGHAEVVKVTYNPNVISIEQILDAFYEEHDPTQENRQGLDIGSQYRSCIFYSDMEQQASIEKSIEVIRQQYAPSKVYTVVGPIEQYWKAEEMHQKYLEKAGQSCQKGSTDAIMCYN